MEEAERARRRELKTELQRYQSIQQRLAGEGDPDLRYIFPTTDGAELISRWDMARQRRPTSSSPTSRSSARHARPRGR